jgi:response regulator NasT
MPISATIMVVDDQPFVRRTLRSLLAEQSHWKVYEAENGKVALDRIRELKPHVVVMDIVMPEMSGTTRRKKPTRLPVCSQMALSLRNPKRAKH